MPSPSDPPEPAVRLVLLGPHTRVVAALCASCPMGPAGCCNAPPDLSWADIGRLAALDGAAWIVAEIAAGRLRRGPRGLIVRTVEVAASPAAKKCVYHGYKGCTLSPDRRSAACNYYVCGDALASGGPEVASAEVACAAWTAQYHTWDEILSAEVAGWAGRPDAPEADIELFNQLGQRFRELAGLKPSA